MSASRSIKAMIVLLAFALCILCFSLSSTPAMTKRGDVPQCQQECLALHSQRMKQLSDEYMKTGDKMGYQDRVDEEVLSYSRCLTNCRELHPIK